MQLRKRSLSPILPWYREPWPWILMAAPAAAVLAGAVTLALAVRSSDGLVAEDYYKQGLAVNQQLARVEAAQARGLAATLTLDPAAAGPVELRFTAGAGELPAALNLVLSHPTRAGLDRSVRLVAVGDARYAGRIAALAPGRWHATVEDDGRHWRIAGELQAPQARVAQLLPGQ
jgi:hypothetical protein